MKFTAHRSSYVAVVRLWLAATAPVESLAQSRRVRPGTPSPSQPVAREASPDAAALYEETVKIVETRLEEQKKARKRVGRTMLKEIQMEQTRLAVRNATRLSGRTALKDEELFYLGMLYALAENDDATIETLKRFLGGRAESIAPKQAQTARGHWRQHARKPFARRGKGARGVYRPRAAAAKSSLFVKERWLSLSTGRKLSPTARRRGI